MSGVEPAPWTLRPAELEDVPVLARLERELFPDDHWSPQTLRLEIGHRTRSYWVAVSSADPAEIIGYGGIMVVGPTADVHSVAVVERHRGAGLGSALLRRFHEDAVERGAEEVLLEVRESNEPAQSLYRRFGYRPIARRPRYYPDGETALVMRRELKPPAPPTTTDLTAHMKESQ